MRTTNLVQDVTSLGGGALREIGWDAPSESVTVTAYVSTEPPRFYRLDGSVIAPPVRRGSRCATPARRVLPRRRGAGRPRAQATRSSAASGDSGDDSDSEPPAADRWRWASEASWRSFVASIRSRDFEREIARERMAGWSL